MGLLRAGLYFCCRYFPFEKFYLAGWVQFVGLGQDFAEHNAGGDELGVLVVPSVNQVELPQLIVDAQIPRFHSVTLQQVAMKTELHVPMSDMSGNSVARIPRSRFASQSVMIAVHWTRVRGGQTAGSGYEFL